MNVCVHAAVPWTRTNPVEGKRKKNNNTRGFSLKMGGMRFVPGLSEWTNPLNQTLLASASTGRPGRFIGHLFWGFWGCLKAQHQLNWSVWGRKSPKLVAFFLRAWTYFLEGSRFRGEQRSLSFGFGTQKGSLRELMMMVRLFSGRSKRKPPLQTSGQMVPYFLPDSDPADLLAGKMEAGVPRMVFCRGLVLVMRCVSFFWWGFRMGGPLSICRVMVTTD